MALSPSFLNAGKPYCSMSTPNLLSPAAVSAYPSDPFTLAAYLVCVCVCVCACVRARARVHVLVVRQCDTQSHEEAPFTHTRAHMCPACNVCMHACLVARKHVRDRMRCNTRRASHDVLRAVRRRPKLSPCSFVLSLRRHVGVCKREGHVC